MIFKTEKSEYDIALDIIRILAIILVVFTHTGPMGSKLYTISENRYEKLFSLGLDIFRTINVPLFFMISGALLLKKNETISQLLLKRIFRYSCSLVLFSYLYFMVDFREKWYDLSLFFKALYCNDTVYIPGHFWFLYSYLGYLIILPFFRKMVKTMQKQEFLYWIVLGILFKSVFRIVDAFAGVGTIGVAFRFATDMAFYPIMGYFFYYVLKKENYQLKYLTIGWILSIFGVIVSAFMVYEDRVFSGEWSEQYLDIATVYITLTIFYTVKYLCYNCRISKMLSTWIQWLGEKSFGVYIFHVLLYKPLAFVYSFLCVFFPQFVSCLVYCISIVVVGSIITSVLQKIPILRNLL